MSGKATSNYPIFINAVRALVLIGFTSIGALVAVTQTAVTTYHNDNNRTGWNQSETVLTPANVGSTAFGLLLNVALDDQVDAQPLVVPGVVITAGHNQGLHDVVYVATEHNSVYAIDVHSGTVLLSPNFGAPVSRPLGCNNNGPNVGINSTPVIDLSSNTLYVMAYTQASGGPTYTIHALDLGSLTDKLTPTVVTASHTLVNGSSFVFNATYQRQRPALLLANGNVYAGFGSFCDIAGTAQPSRGWLLGWNATTLAPLSANELFDIQATSQSTYLSSIWMSGYGLAADDSGNIVFTTGNSASGTYDGVTNIQESVIKVSPNLTSIVDLFTPSNQAHLDNEDGDFGSGGVLVLPDQPGSLPHLAVAAGKDGNMYFLNEDDLGGYSSTTNNVLGTYSIQPCWCGPSYFADPSDGAGRVVTSAGDTLTIWKVQTSPQVTLTNVAHVYDIPGGQDPGFFTSVSSNGTANPIIWAISRPTSTSNGAPISLYAFNPESGGSPLTQLFESTAGSWPNVSGNANLVPTVANGLVFVASNKQLQIFGLPGVAIGTTTVLTSSVNPSLQGKPVVFTATVTSQSGGATPAGTLKLLNGTSVLATLTLTSGSASYTISTLPPGVNSITAVYEGNASYGTSSSSPLSQTVLATTTTALTSSLPSSIYGQPVTFSATVTSNNGTPPNGDTVTFMQGTTVLGTGTLNGGTATLSISTLGVGNKAIKAIYGGDSAYAASASTTHEETISKATSAVGLTSSSASSSYEQPVVFTATISPEFSGVPTGTVTFENGTATLGKATLSRGTATFTTTKLAVGTESITAVYGGSASFSANTSPALSQVVNAANTTTTLVSSLNPSNAGQSVTFTATLGAQFGGTVTGSVTFTDGSTTLNTVTLVRGSAKLTTSSLASGTHNITAIYNGSADFATSSAALTQTVN
jgi:hypothetical protein